MSLYFLLGTLTYDGQKMLYANPNLIVESIRNTDVEGAEILGQYAVLGKYDFVMMCEANDNDAVARLSLELGVHTGMHFETLPAIAINVLIEDDEEELRDQDAVSAATPPSEEWRVPRRDSGF